jgi:ATP/maltotriose-dependent transcriptional regulator MalT
VGLSLAEDADHSWIQPLANAVAALSLACRGAWEAADAHVLAASGGPQGSRKSNRQIAAEMVVSPKTLEYHLGNVFSKLGISSRAMLAARYGR